MRPDLSNLPARRAPRPAGPVLAAVAVVAAAFAFPPPPAADDGARAPMSREEFDAHRQRIGAEAAAREGERLSAILRLFERDGDYVDEEVRRRVDRGEPEAEALDAVAGKGREERIASARRRLLEVHLPTERDRWRIEANHAAVEAAMAAAGFTAGDVFSAIPLVESTYDPTAFTIAARLGGETVKGMWQFTESTGRDHGLAVTSLGADEARRDPDERYDPRKSSLAARSYIDFLEGFEFASGCPATRELVLASWHMGQGNANRKIRKYGCDFWGWRKDGEDGFGTHSYNYPALVIAGGRLLNEMGVAR